MGTFKFCCAIACSCFIGLTARASATHCADTAAERLNVLFILVDDLRPELGCYGMDYAVTPDINRFADTGTVFNRAYAAVAVCSPSRDSLLTGLRPANTGCYNIPDGPHWHRNPSHIALPRLFKDSGYTVSGYGKIAHNMLRLICGRGLALNICDVRALLIRFGRRPDLSLMEGQVTGLKDEALWESLDRPSVECADVQDAAYGDGAVAEAVVAELEDFAESK